VRVLSVLLGRPRALVWRGRELCTSIFKEPALGRVRVEPLGLVGDTQSDPRVHGGPSKALYAYPSEHYAFWRAELELGELAHGSFGENLTLAGLFESDVRVGDRLRIGSAWLAATQPRIPCLKLAARFGRKDMIERFLSARRSGFYLAVVEPGELGAGDRIERHRAETPAPTMAELFEAHASRGAR
jgi:MOSC domain-containing protein YiiM